MTLARSEVSRQETPVGSAPGIDGERSTRDVLLDGLQASLVSKRHEWVTWRAGLGVENRWRDDMDVYYGRGDAIYDDENYQPKWFERKAATSPAGPMATRSKVRVNITASKTDTGIARAQEILLPTDDRNWAIKRTPVPELAFAAKDEREVFDAAGQRLGKVKDAAKKLIAQANERAERMQAEIDDQLTECQYNEACRETIEWGGLLGTGILKGPVIVRRERDTQVAETDESSGRLTMMSKSISDLVPASEAIDPRNFYPDPECGNDLLRASGAFERRLINRGDLRRLAGRKGYLPERIRQVLTEQPKRTVMGAKPGEEKTGIWTTRPGEIYELWEFHGEVDGAELAALMRPTDEGAPADIDPLLSARVCVIMVNDWVIGGYEYYTRDQDGLIYDVFNWKQDKETIFGYGLPWVYRTQQRVINAGWRAAMDNMGVSSGAILVYKRGKLVPADGRHTLEGRKTFWAADDVDDVEKALRVFDIPSKLADIIALINLARELGDEEANLPAIMQGLKGTAPDQVGSLLALMQKAEGVLRRVVKNFDDRVTKRHIRRYYGFNMRHSPKQEIKGDMQVDARGADVLFMQEARHNLMQLLATLTQHPVFGPWLKPKKIIEEIARSGKVSPEDVVKTQDEYEADLERAAQQPQPKDPRVEVAEIKAATDKEIAAADRDADLRKAVAQIMRDEGLTAQQAKTKLAERVMQIKAEDRRDVRKQRQFDREARLRETTGAGI
jgi:hypothetical protein